MSDAGVQIELQFLITLLNDTKLCITFRYVGCALIHTTQFAGLHIEADGQGLARQFDVVCTVHLHPLIVATQTQRSLFDLGIAHQMSRCLEGRTVSQRTNMLCNTGAHKVPDSTAHQSRMTTDNGPILIQSTTGITSYRQVLVHERRARVLRFGHHRRVHLQLIGCRVARTYNLLAGMGVGVAAIHKIACGVESLTLLDHFGNQRSLATLVARTPE